MNEKEELKEESLTGNDVEEQKTTEKEFLSDKVAVLSPTRLVLNRFFRSKLSVVGIIILVALFLFSFLGPVVMKSTYGYGELTIDETADVEFLTTELSYYNADGELVTGFKVIKQQLNYDKLSQPSKEHLLGTDESGYDILTRLMYGGRISLTIGFIVVFMETLIGVILGGLAGYFGKWVDQLIMRIVDIFYCVPSMPIMLISSAVIESAGVPEKYRIYFLMLILTFFGWAGTARLVRGQILSLREQEYMLAAKAGGLSTSRKIFKHLLPNVMPQLIVSMTLGLGSVILTESSLSFLGIGVPIPYAAWGSMIGRIQSFEILKYHVHLWGPPGLCIALAVLAFNFIGDGLRDAFDPKMKR